MLSHMPHVLIGLSGLYIESGHRIFRTQRKRAKRTMDAYKKKMYHTNLKSMEALTHRMWNLITISSSRETSLNMLLRSTTDFLHDSQSGVLFKSWFKHQEDMFAVDLADKEDKAKVCFFLRKLRPAEHTRYVDLILTD